MSFLIILPSSVSFLPFVGGAGASHRSFCTGGGSVGWFSLSKNERSQLSDDGAAVVEEVVVELPKPNAVPLAGFAASVCVLAEKASSPSNRQPSGAVAAERSIDGVVVRVLTANPSSPANKSAPVPEDMEGFVG